MAFTQSQIDALESAIADGVLKVEYDDKRVTYRSLSEMERTLAKMKQAVNPTNTSNVAGRFGKVFANTNKGLN